MRKVVLSFVIILLILSCEKNSFAEDVAPLESTLESLFDKSVFKKTIPYSYDVDWSSSEKKYSEDLKTHIYEFDLKYKTPFNPTNVNKTKTKGYNTAYRLVVVEDEENDFSFFMAKFYQEKRDHQDIESLDISLNRNVGYNGITRLYNSDNELVLAKVIKKEEDNDEKTNVTKEGLNTLEIATRGTITKCKTTTIYHYIDWYRYTYDIYGNLISVEYLYTEYKGSSSNKTCITETIPDEPIRIPKSPSEFFPCHDGSGRMCANEITEGIECQNGFSPDENDDCVDIDSIEEVDGEDTDEIINELTGKAKCVYDRLENLDLFKKTIKTFDDIESYNLILTTKGSCVGGGSGCTNFDERTNTATIKIIDIKQPSLDLAATILHEGIHADIYKFVSQHEKGKVNANDRPRLMQLYFYYKKLADSKVIDPRHFNTIYQHEHMAEKYVKPIAQALRQLDGNRFNINHYYWFAWEGLEKTYSFKSKLTESTKKEYKRNKARVNDTTNFKCN